MVRRVIVTGEVKLFSNGAEGKPSVKSATSQILLELPGIKEPERVRKLLQGSANLEFYETYTLQELQSALAQLSDAAQAAATYVRDSSRHCAL